MTNRNTYLATLRAHDLGDVLCGMIERPKSEARVVTRQSKGPGAGNSPRADQ